MMLRLLLIGAFLAAPSSQEGAPAKALFDRMEAKLRDVKSLSFRCRVEMSGEGVGRGFVEGPVVLQGRKMARSEMGGILDGTQKRYLFVADGTKSFWTVNGFGDGGGPVPATVNRNILLWLGRADLFNALYMGLALEWSEAGIDAGVRLKMADFKMGEKGKIGKRDAQSIEYVVTCKSADLRYETVLWIDAEHTVPLRKEMSVPGFGKIVEKYTGYRIDAEIPAATFTLPKK